MLLAQVMLPAAASALATATPAPRTVVVAGATGRSGRLLVEELLKGETVVRALVRDRTKAAETLPSHPNLSLIDCDLASDTAAATTREACASANGLVWCASGFTSDGVSLDVKCMGELPLALKVAGAADARVVMLSSAGVTRTEWPEAKQTALVGAADIPIIRLNPGGILDRKREAEAILRRSGVPYAVVRPTGLKDDWPAGRPILSQGDVAVGRTAPADLARVLVSALTSPGRQRQTLSLSLTPSQTLSRSRSRIRSLTLTLTLTLTLALPLTLALTLTYPARARPSRCSRSPDTPRRATASAARSRRSPSTPKGRSPRRR